MQARTLVRPGVFVCACGGEDDSGQMAFEKALVLGAR